MLFDIDTMPADEPEATPTNVVAFPAEITALEAVRHARRTVAKLEQKIADSDPNSPDVKERITAGMAPAMLETWREDLKAAEAAYAALTSDWKLTHRGQTFTTVAGRA